jgi:DNA-binding XRE family transcriptional regulator
MKRVKFASGKQKIWLQEVKHRSRMTWNDLARFIGVSRATMFNYLAENYLIPLAVVRKLEKFGLQVKAEWIDELREDGWYRKARHRETSVHIPRPEDVELAEFLGALLGDGHIGSRNAEISIVCNRRVDSVYVRQFLAPLIRRLFNKVPKVYEGKNDNTVRCKLYSKRVHDFLTHKIGLPAGKKVASERLRIPKSYFKSDKYLIACLRGLFDTDGGIYRHRERDPMIEFSSHNLFLSADVMTALKRLGLNASTSQGKVYIYAKNDIVRFFEVVGSRNPRNLFKFQVWKEKGVVPKTSDVRS